MNLKSNLVDNMKNNKVIVIVGPTASGKTGLSIELAKKYNGEIVSADSMQIYKDMNIATAKPTIEEMCGIKHHLIDFLNPGETYSVGQYVLDAENAISDILSRNKTPIVCGGTGLYVDSLINGINFTEDSSDDKIRNELYQIAETEGIDYLLNVLKEFDPDSYENLSQQRNLRRIIRAIEFYKVTGKTITQQNIESQNTSSKFDYLIIGLNADDRQFLYDRINRRVDLMIESGLIEETKSVLQMNLSDTSIKAIGYKELIPYINNQSSLDDCIEKLKMETRRYAKRQLTWFRRNKMINWIYIDRYSSLNDIVKVAVNIIDKKEFLNG
ncbi:MAG: tRNA (adenosine(37)-N6)-dimethylallyltransferase MiaA [Oscillospiraceae bacterium]|nr:tRNA (adenosine(37)-N6)-dimethylallyltransferase MiaA [Oscillospiraceae bacterium]